LYPNPVKDKLFLQFDGNTNAVQITVSNVLGETVNKTNFTNSEGEIEFISMPSGVYFLTLQSQSQQQVFKVVKE